MKHISLFHGVMGEWAGETFDISRDICIKIFSDKSMNPYNKVRDNIDKVYYRMRELS